MSDLPQASPADPCVQISEAIALGDYRAARAKLRTLPEGACSAEQRAQFAHTLALDPILPLTGVVLLALVLGIFFSAQ